MNDFGCTVDYSGMQEMLDFINEYPSRVQSTVQRTARTALQWIARDTPVKTGAAARSWEVQDFANEEGFYGCQVSSITGSGAKYTPFLEEGTGIYGPFQREIIAAECTKSGGPFFWMTPGRSRGKGKGRIMYYAFATKTKGMPAAHMLAKNESAIEDLLGENMQRQFDLVKGS